MPDTVKQIVDRNKELDSKNSNWRNYHQELANFCLPRKAYITTPRISGDRLQYNYLYDMTAIRAVKKFVSGFHSNLVNPSTRWHGLTLVDENLMTKNLEVWFDQVVDIMFAVRNQTNFDNVMKEAFAQYVVFGTAPVLSMPHPKEKITYTSITLDGLNIEEDITGKVVGVYRNWKPTAMQAFMMWGNDVGKTIGELVRDKPDDEVELLHYVGPRDRRRFDKFDDLNMAFQSKWIAKKDQHVMQESGFERNPFQVPRFWKENNQAFGYSPAMDVLADIKLMNAALKTWLRRSMKEADPPILVPSKGFVLPLNLNPTGMNYRKESAGTKQIENIGVGAGSFSITRDFIDYIQRNIQEGFFNDVFQSFNLLTKQMTVPEVQQRIREGMVLLGPTVNQIQHELLDPLIIRDFFLLLDQGMFPEPPEEFFDQDFIPVYESPLARAAKQSELDQADQWVLRAGNLAAIAGESVLDRVDGDAYVQEAAKKLGVDPRLIRSDQEVEALAEQRAQIAQAQAQLQAGQQVAAIAKDGARAIKDTQEVPA